jgi:hypothetical protein
MSLIYIAVKPRVDADTVNELDRSLDTTAQC